LNVFPLFHCRERSQPLYGTDAHATILEGTTLMLPIPSVLAEINKYIIDNSLGQVYAADQKNC
jgi:hypothetical protein